VLYMVLVEKLDDLIAELIEKFSQEHNVSIRSTSNYINGTIRIKVEV
jgi:hypothetical protein